MPKCSLIKFGGGCHALRQEDLPWRHTHSKRPQGLLIKFYLLVNYYGKI